jgi:hypothetical protein
VRVLRSLAFLAAFLLFSGTAGASFSVTDHGALGNARRVTDCVIASGSNQLHSASANWSSADIGAVVWAVDSSTNKLTGQTTITGFTSSTQVTIGVNALHSSAPYCEITYGHDETQAFLDTHTAAGAFGMMTIPGGGYILTNKFYAAVGNSALLIGENKANTFLYPSPDFPIPGGHAPVWIDVQSASGEVSGFSIIGSSYLYPMTGFQTLIRVLGSNVKLDFSVSRVGCLSSGLPSASAMSLESSNITGTVNIFTQGGALSQNVSNVMTALHMVGSTGTITGVGLSNYRRNLVLDSCIARQGIGALGTGTAGLNFVGGLIDENYGEASVSLTNGSDVNFSSMTIWANNNNVTSPVTTGYAVSVDATSKVWLTSVDLGGYFIGNVGIKALMISTGGKARAVLSTFRSASLFNDVAIDNYGTFFNVGGNNSTNGGTSVQVDVPITSAFLPGTGGTVTAGL